MASDSHSQNFESQPPELEAVVDAFLDAWTDSTSPPVISEYLELCEAVFTSAREHRVITL